FRADAAREVEFRGAADDNFTVWVNGERAFGFEEYRNGVRLDRHRFRVRLRAGVNTVLVKVCQAPSTPANREPNWEFLLRITDASGNGLAVKSALPAERWIPAVAAGSKPAATAVTVSAAVWAASVGRWSRAGRG